MSTQNNKPNNPTTSNYQSILSKKGSSPYRPSGNNANTYLSFRERVEQSPFLVSFENQNNLKNNIKQKKKEINSYVSNKDKLFIPRPERVHQGIDIYKNLIEEEKKIITADLGIQSDEIDYENTEQEFIPQKLGKDQGTQIMDGDLFNFDKDVNPLLTVIVGKTLEQSLLEIEQEDEIANLREAKIMYLHKKKDDDKRVKNLEDREIQKKYNNDAKKGQRKIIREVRKKTQKELLSRVISKTYLRDLYKNSTKDLIYRGHFRNYLGTKIKNKTNNILMSGSEKLNNMFINMNTFLKNSLNNKLQNFINVHENSVKERHIFLQKIAEQEERKRKEEEQRKIQEELDRKERRRKRKIERIKKEIKESIIDNAVQKSDAYNEEIVEIGNNGNNEEPYIGVYGGFFGLFVMTLNILQRDVYQDESLFTIDNLSEIFRMVFDEVQCTINLHFDFNAKNKVEEILNNVENNNENEDEEKQEIQVTDLRNLSDLSTDTWNKIGDVLENIEYNSDIYLKNYIEEFSNNLYDKEGNEITAIIKDDFIYKMLIRALIDMCAKGSYNDHYKLILDSPIEEEEKEEKDEKNENEEEEEKKEEKKEKTFDDILKEYEAVCMLEWKKSTEDIIENCDYVRPNRKKNVPAPDLENDFIQVKAYQNNQNVAEGQKVHNVLLYDRIEEFCLRNKIFECALAHFNYVSNIDNDSPTLFKAFNKTFDECIDNSKISNTIQVYHYAPEDDKANEGEEEEES